MISAKTHPLHSMCGYLGSFPPGLPRSILDRWVPRRARVLDPFCGGGTTLIESLLRGSPCIGIDLNPLAVAISRAKVQSVQLEDVLYRLSQIAREYPGETDYEVPEGVRTIFHPRTLSQLCFLRSALDPSSPEDCFIQGATLGILHGNACNVHRSSACAKGTLETGRVGRAFR